MLVLEHCLEPREGTITLWALGLEAHPEFKALDMAEMLTVRELLEPVTLFVVSEANEASDNTQVDKLISVGDHSHLDKILWVHSLLDHVVYAILTQCLHCVLVLGDLLLDVLNRVFIDL